MVAAEGSHFASALVSYAIRATQALYYFRRNSRLESGGC